MSKNEIAGKRWWTKAWNPITGCANLSCPVRKDCWAKGMCNRFDKLHSDPDFGKMMFHIDRIDDPLHWNIKQKIFVGSLGDMWQPKVPDNWIEEILFRCRQENNMHVYQFLTKNPQRYIDYCNTVISNNWGVNYRDIITPNCWLGFTDYANTISLDTIRTLRETFPKHILFVSYEPFSTWRPDIINLVDWVIVGGWSGDKLRCRYSSADIVEVSVLIERCRRNCKPVFVKSNLKQYLPDSFYLQQFPEVK